MHEHMIIEHGGGVIDAVSLCSDPCHRDWCQKNNEDYDGWSRCQESEFTIWCEACGVVIPGAVEDEKGQPCECQMDNVVVNRFLSIEGEKCEHDNWVQLPNGYIDR